MQSPDTPPPSVGDIDRDYLTPDQLIAAQSISLPSSQQWHRFRKGPLRIVLGNLRL